MVVVIYVVRVTGWVGVVNVVKETGLVVESMRKKDGLGVCGQ